MNSKIENKEDAMVDEIDLLEVFHVLWNKAITLIICFVIGVAVSGIGTECLITPQYEAQSTIYIYSKTTSITNLADLQIGSALTVDFQIIAKTREVIEEVIDKLSLNTTYRELVHSIVVANPKSSHMLTIKVKNTDPALAANISNALADVLREQIAEVMSTDKPSTVERAVIPSSPCSPNVKKNMAVGGLLCLIAAATVILIRYFVDDTIQSEEDVTKYLGLNTLAAVPMEHELQKSKRKSIGRSNNKRGSNGAKRGLH